MLTYCMEKSGLGIMLLMLGMSEPCGEDRSMINLFFPEYFRVAMGLIRNAEKRRLVDSAVGPFSSLNSVLTVVHVLTPCCK